MHLQASKAAVCLVVAGFALAHSGAMAEPPPAPTAAARALFDGRTLDGWEGDGKLWRVEDGALTGGSLTETVKQNDFLASKRSFTNFIVRMKIKLTGKEGFINSGFQIRSQRVPNSSEMAGYQCDFGDPNWWGAIYDESRRDKVLSPSDMTALGSVIRRNDWNDYVIRANGPRLTTWINGVQGTDYVEEDDNIPDFGKLGIQIHGGGKALVQVKAITIEELLPTLAGSRFVGAPESAKSTNTAPLSAEAEQATFTLPPGFEIELVAKEEEGLGKFVTVDWDLQGRMWSMTALEYPVDGNENPAAAQALYASAGKDKVLVWDSPYGPGPHPARVFAEGLAIPLGILPYKNGVYVQHGPDIAFLSDTDGDGKADKRDVILTGFGVQDSHLFPHQFTRAPGNWIWFAQGAFNFGKVKTTRGTEQQFDRTRMARFRYDGSDFDITSQGPCNIWGFALNDEGEAFIQEANDYGYPMMPFHAYANYPGCSDALFKSYAPEFPGAAPHFRMGGTGLSGLALSDRKAWPEAYASVFYVANPITRKIQAIRAHRDGPRYRLQKLPDFVQSSDEMFRPVALKLGPDGCLYIVDWYNKIISHNEVPRNHPERDKKRGRIWRVRHKEQRPFEVRNFLKLSPEELVATLGGDSLAQTHLAWQAITDRQLKELAPRLRTIAADSAQPAAKRIPALWSLEGLRQVDPVWLRSLLSDASRNVRREAVRAFAGTGTSGKELAEIVAPLVDDSDPEVRGEVIRLLGPLVGESPEIVRVLITFARASLPGPTASSTQSGKPIKIGEAYEREFERYLVRFFLEQQPAAMLSFLESTDTANLPLENRLLATLALDPKASASRIARLLPQMKRTAGDEEILRLAQFVHEAGAAEALTAMIAGPETRRGAIESLLRVRSRFDATPLAASLTNATQTLWGRDRSDRSLALRLISGFRLGVVAGRLDRALAVDDPPLGSDEIVPVIRTLRELGSTEIDGLLRQVKNPIRAIADEAVLALASSRNELASEFVLKKLWTGLSDVQRRSALIQLAGTRRGAASIVDAVLVKDIEREAIDAPLLDKLNAALPGDPRLAMLTREISALWRPVLRLNGKDDAWADTGIALEGPFTVETWIKLDPGIGNEDGILGAPGVLDMNFYEGRLRAWVGGGTGDAIVAKKPIVPDTWTQVAISRDSLGKFRLYQNGELDTDQSKVVTGAFGNLRVGWSGPDRGTAGWFTEFRVWNETRTAEQIRANFDRSLQMNSEVGGVPQSAFPGLVRYFPGGGPWEKLQGGARVEGSGDFPELLDANEAAAQEQKFERYRALDTLPGDVEKGRGLFKSVCMACHSVGGEGGQIGPVLNGAGALGLEPLLRNLLTPNAAMEAGYRIFRVELKNGDVLDGFFISEDVDAVIIRAPNIPDRRTARSEIRRTGFLRRSLMPEGLLEALSDQQASDLLGFLRTLK